MVTDEKRWRDRIYLVSGVVMIGALAWAGIAGASGAPIFLPEAIALIVFAVSWLTKGRAARTLKRAVLAAAGSHPPEGIGAGPGRTELTP